MLPAGEENRACALQLCSRQQNFSYYHYLFHTWKPSAFTFLPFSKEWYRRRDILTDLHWAAASGPVQKSLSIGLRLCSYCLQTLNHLWKKGDPCFHGTLGLGHSVVWPSKSQCACYHTGFFSLHHLFMEWEKHSSVRSHLCFCCELGLYFHYVWASSLNNPGGAMPAPVLNVENGGLKKGNMCYVTELARG